MAFNPPLLSLPKGLTWDYTKSPKFSTISQSPQSGRHPAQATLQASTIFDLELTYDYLQDSTAPNNSSLVYLQEFYEAMRGSWGFFLFDPSEYNLQTMSLTQDYTQLQNGFCGEGDGSTTTFPLWRASSVLGGGNVTLLERIQSTTLLAGVYVNGTLEASSAYTHTDLPSQITFATAPAVGATVAWAGNYRYLCKFSDDTADFEEFMYQLWKMKSLKLTTVNL